MDAPPEEVRQVSQLDWRRPGWQSVMLCIGGAQMPGQLPTVKVALTNPFIKLRQ